MRKWLITIGLALLAVGLLWPVLGKLPLGRLPGDIVVDRPHFKIYVPITTMVLVSLLVSFILWLMRK